MLDNTYYPIILDELHKNLSEALLKDLYSLLREAKVEIIEHKVPIDLISKYKLPYEDAVIASYCEYLRIDILVSENRHFLVGFYPKNFKVLSAHGLLTNTLLL